MFLFYFLSLGVAFSQFSVGGGFEASDSAQAGITAETWCDSGIHKFRYSTAICPCKRILLHLNSAANMFTTCSSMKITFMSYSAVHWSILSHLCLAEIEIFECTRWTWLITCSISLCGALKHLVTQILYVYPNLSEFRGFFWGPRHWSILTIQQWYKKNHLSHSQNAHHKIEMFGQSNFSRRHP